MSKPIPPLDLMWLIMETPASPRKRRPLRSWHTCRTVRSIRRNKVDRDRNRLPGKSKP